MELTTVGETHRTSLVDQFHDLSTEPYEELPQNFPYTQFTQALPQSSSRNIRVQRYMPPPRSIEAQRYDMS